MNRRSLIVLFATTAGGLLAGCTTTDLLSTNDGPSRDETAASLDLINALRASKGLASVSANRSAQAAALHQAKRMASAGKMSHLIGLSDSFSRRMNASGVPLPAAENIAVGQADAAAAFEAWRRSPKHLENMLGNYRGLGVAVAQNPSSSNRPYWAMVLSG
ncbi:CAP domain-containing protein [Agrobacterium sp. ES01]|uniref:CAP domain-containing protein n=1 Tax=Agrobacterium sp. ES01 TaxID=3420714 RepID=UPI003D1407F4